MRIHQDTQFGNRDSEEYFDTDELIAMLIGPDAEAQRDFMQQVLEHALTLRNLRATSGGKVVRRSPFIPYAA
ncbi:MAG: hypothetical protein ABJQ29_13000 [Luteolibacter sp.]